MEARRLECRKSEVGELGVGRSTVKARNPAVGGRRSEVRGGKRKVGGGKKIKRALYRAFDFQAGRESSAREARAMIPVFA